MIEDVLVFVVPKLSFCDINNNNNNNNNSSSHTCARCHGLRAGHPRPTQPSPVSTSVRHGTRRCTMHESNV